jgi:DMSO/TMAO reductase YedYZ heme-binding membrane subunit
MPGPFLVVFALAGAAAGEMTSTGRGIATAVGQFALFYGGVFALLALTAAVAVGLLATDRMVLTPGGRIISQAMHRTVSLAAVGFLAVHIVMEVIAGRSRPADSVVPFLDPHRTLYVGLGTVAADLLLLIAVTGVVRGRFAGRRPVWAWRALHALAYLAWPLAIVHGLLAGRTARPYVDWSYGACVAAVGLALGLRLMSSARPRETADSPVALGWPPAGPALPPDASLLLPVPPARSAPRALPGPAAEPHGGAGRADRWPG